MSDFHISHYCNHYYHKIFNKIGFSKAEMDLHFWWIYQIQNFILFQIFTYHIIYYKIIWKLHVLWRISSNIIIIVFFFALSIRLCMFLILLICPFEPFSICCCCYACYLRIFGFFFPAGVAPHWFLPCVYFLIFFAFARDAHKWISVLIMSLVLPSFLATYIHHIFHCIPYAWLPHEDFVVLWHFGFGHSSGCYTYASILLLTRLSCCHIRLPNAIHI